MAILFAPDMRVMIVIRPGGCGTTEVQVVQLRCGVVSCVKTRYHIIVLMFTVARLQVAERWAGTPMPNNAPPDAVYRPICPYCAKPLLGARKGDRPYSKIIFLQS